MPADPPTPTPTPVEAMLRDAARQRRAGFDAAGPDAGTMPGPMRTRLHAELAKRFDAAPAAPTPRGWLARWWPVLAGATGAAAAVALFVVAGPRPAGSPVASAPATPRAAPTPPAVDAPAKEAPAAPPHQVAAADQSAALAKDKLESAVNAPPPPPEPVRSQTFTQTPLLPLAAVATTAPRGEYLARRAAPSSGNARAGAPAPAAAPAPPAPTVAMPAPLLGSFRFEQRGENVRVVDADGSVYVGQVEPDAAKTSAAAQAEARGGKAQAKVAEAPQQSAENFRFRAAGDNRTLRKPVVFEGQYSGNAADASGSANNQPAITQSKVSAAAAPTPEAQIRGRVRVLDEQNAATRDAEVDARSVEPIGPR